MKCGIFSPVYSVLLCSEWHSLTPKDKVNTANISSVKVRHEAGNLISKLRTIAALTEDTCLKLQTYMASIVCNLSSRDPMPPSGLCDHQACTWYT